MPINAQIPLGVQPMQLPMPDPNQGMNALARMMQIQGMQQEQGLNSMKIDEYKRGIDDQNALRSALSAPGADPYNSLLKLGKIKEATDFAKGQADVAKNKSETEAKQIETAHKRVDSWGQAMGFVRQNPTPENAMAAVQHLVTMGVMPPEMAQQALAGVQNNPQSIAQWATQGFQAALQAKDQLPKYDTRNLGGSTQMTAVDPVTGQVRVVNSVANTQSPDNAATNATSRANNAATVGATIRGQNLTDARARELNAQGKTQIVETPQGFVIVDKNTGQSRPATGADGQPLKGKANDRVMTDAQAKANLFGTRMKESDRILTQLEAQGVTNAGLVKGAVQGVAGMTPFMGDKMSDAAGSLMNTLPPVLGGPNSDQQQVEQARRDFLNAVLRRESGAVISPSEFANAERQYFPQPGDSKVVLQQKAANRKLAISGLEAEVPGGFRGAQQAPTNAPTKISSDAEYASLPSGATFVGPDGKTRRKP